MFIEALTYDDVLVVPKYSTIVSRKDVSAETHLSRHIKLAMPIVSANMDTVTEGRMAIAMAELGGIGIIHRFLSIEDQVYEVLRVKRFEGFTIDNPYTIREFATLRELREAIRDYGVGGLLVTDQDGKIRGIVTNRDIIFEHDQNKKIFELMTPREKLITAPLGTSLDQAREILARHKIEKLPLVDSDDQLRGLITSKDIVKVTEFPYATKDAKGRLRVGAAIGAKDDIARARALLEAGADALVLDIAHGHSAHVLRTIENLRATFGNIEIIAGNVATPEGTRDLIHAGVDAIKVGIGPGSHCTTRLVAGVGLPQLSAVLECAEAAQGSGVPIIADGGVRFGGDVVKALAAGAASVMVGGLFAGTEESPGMTVNRNGRKYKISRGMASSSANLTRKQLDLKSKQPKFEGLDDYVAEGVEGLAPYKGGVAELVGQLVGGLRSGMSYTNARTLEELRANVTFRRITSAGWKESLPHDVELL